MVSKLDLVTVNVSVNGQTKTIKMERGTRFENKGGIFTAGESKQALKMTNYQLKAFEAMANNYKEEGEKGIVLSKKDIQEAQQKFKQGGFVADMSEFLPEGYKIERPKLTSKENMVQAYVTNGKESQSATLKFSFNNLFKKENVDTAHTTADEQPNNKEVIKDNMFIVDAYSKLNKHEQKAIQLFDADRNGILDARETKGFNSCDFAEDSSGNLVVDYKSADGNKVQIKVSKNEMDTAVLAEIVDPANINTNSLQPKIQTTLGIYKGESISEKINLVLDEFSAEQGLDYTWSKNDIDKNGSIKYIGKAVMSLLDLAEGQNPNIEDYVIFDRTGNVIERKVTLMGAWDNGAYTTGSCVASIDKVAFYSSDDASKSSLIGTIISQDDGKHKYVDADGNCLYYKKYKEVGAGSKHIHEWHEYYYDKNGSLKYIVKHDFKDTYAFEHGFVKIEEYKNGKSIGQRDGTDISLGCHDPEYVDLTELDKDGVIAGVYSFRN